MTMDTHLFRDSCVAVLVLLYYGTLIYYYINTPKYLLLFFVAWYLQRATNSSDEGSRKPSHRSTSEKLDFLFQNHPPLRANETRILVLYPSKYKDAPLEGRFEVYDLGDGSKAGDKADDKRYEAVVYTKDSIPRKGFIGIGSKLLFIPYNLQCVLLKLRHASLKRRLWVDAVCIDLHDTKEMIKQVQLLPRIYARAGRVIAWIGEVDEAEEEAARPALEILKAPKTVLMLMRSGNLAPASKFTVAFKALRHWRKITRQSPLLHKESGLLAKTSFQLGRYDIPIISMGIVAVLYINSLRLPGLKRSVDILPKHDAGAALRVKALLIDYIEHVSDIDEKEQYINGPFSKSWVALGGMEELLKMLRRSHKGSISRKAMGNLVSLLESAYSQSEEDPNPTYRSEAYNKHGPFIKRMKTSTRGNRLFRTARLSKLGLASANAQKKDGKLTPSLSFGPDASNVCKVIFFVPEHSMLLSLRPFSPLSTQTLDSQQYYTLIGACYMGDHTFWQNECPHLINVPLRTVYLMPAMQNKGVHLNEKTEEKPSRLVNPSSVASIKHAISKEAINDRKNLNIQVRSEAEKLQAAVVGKNYSVSWTCVSIFGKNSIIPLVDLIKDLWT
jgi:hypothetical protein